MDLPWRIIRIIASQYKKEPVSASEYEDTKKAFPQYWNSIGEFDPYFKRRNLILNFFRGYANAIRRKRSIDKIMCYAKSKNHGTSRRDVIRRS